VLAIALMIAVSWIFARSTPRRVDRWFRRLQFVSAALYSLGQAVTTRKNHGHHLDAAPSHPGFQPK